MLLVEERLALRKTLPGLAKILLADDTLIREAADSALLASWFREYGCPGLLVPKRLGGEGLLLKEIAPLVRAVGAACPSLGVMMLMHHHTVGAFCFDLIPLPHAKTMLQRVAEANHLVGSAFAESRPGADLLDSTVSCTSEGPAYRLNGYKKPCTMSHHADSFLVGVTAGEGDGKRRGLALVDRQHSRILVEPFWTRPVFKPTGSECIRFVDTLVPSTNVLLPPPEGSETLQQQLAVSQAEVTISTLFQLLMSTVYLGMASRLCELAFSLLPQSNDLLYRACDIEAACMAQYQLAERLDGGRFSGNLLGESMALSHNTLGRLDELLSDVKRQTQLLENPECSYLLQACACAHYHPPRDSVRQEILRNCYLLQ